jgi:hypothetical protein
LKADRGLGTGEFADLVIRVHISKPCKGEKNVLLIRFPAVGAFFQTARPLVIPIECFPAAFAGNFDCRHTNEF